MTKKERVIAAIEGREPDKIPSGFSLHFPKEVAFGDAAVDTHIRFFEESDTDILKIMNENLVPYMGEILHGSDYQMVREMTLDDPFMQDQITLVKKILERCDRSAFLLGTLHGVTASSIHWKRWTLPIPTTVCGRSSASCSARTRTRCWQGCRGSRMSCAIWQENISVWV